MVVGAFFAVVLAVPPPGAVAAAGAFWGVTGGDGVGLATLAGSGVALAGSGVVFEGGVSAFGAAGADPPLASVSRI